MDNFKANEAEDGRSCVLNPLDPEEFRRQAHIVVDFIADYYRDIAKFPIRSQVEPNYLRERLPETAPHDQEPLETILDDIHKHIIPGITHWQSPSYFAYFPCTTSTASFLGEMLCTGFNVAGFSWICSPAATELESIVMDWLGKMLNLPESFLFSGNGGGVIQGTTCEAILCSLIASRDLVLARIGRENIGKLVVYGSDQTHSALQKASQIAGIFPSNFREVQTSRSTSFALSPEALQDAISSDMDAGLVPLFLCATVGTTSSTAIDPIAELCLVARGYGIWVHVDAAYAGSACICPEFQHYIDGVEGADSFSLNAHKWLFTSLECCCLWVKDPIALVKALSTDPEYLRNKASESKRVIDYKDWQIPLTRRFRAMKLWLVLRSYGVANLRSYLRSHIKMAQRFAALVDMDKRFEIVTPRTFSMVCFRLAPPVAGKSDRSTNGSDLRPRLSKFTIDEDEHLAILNRSLLEAVNASGHVYMTHAVVGGMYVIRFAVGATLTEERHVIEAWEVIQEHATALLGKGENGVDRHLLGKKIK